MDSYSKPRIKMEWYSRFGISLMHQLMKAEKKRFKKRKKRVLNGRSIGYFGEMTVPQLMQK